MLLHSGLNFVLNKDSEIIHFNGEITAILRKINRRNRKVNQRIDFSDFPESGDDMITVIAGSVIVNYLQLQLRFYDVSRSSFFDLSSETP